MHYYCLVATKEDPRDTPNYEPVETVLRPYGEYGIDMEDDLVQMDDRFWDWWVAGGRYAGRITPDKKEWVYTLGDVRHIIEEELPFRFIGYGHNACREVYDPEESGEWTFWDYPGIVRYALKRTPDDAFITIVDYHS